MFGMNAKCSCCSSPKACHNAVVGGNKTRCMSFLIYVVTVLYIRGCVVVRPVS